MNDDLTAEILDAIPASLRGLSGTALYSGLEAWIDACPIYLLGINPGGDPDEITGTIYEGAARLLNSPEFHSYSEYRDSQWGAPGGGLRPAGAHPFQRSVMHLLDALDLDAGKVPSSNMVYVRSRRAHHIDSDAMDGWAEECWPFHERMIERLGVRVVVAMGGQVGRFVRQKLRTGPDPVETFREANRRGWASHTFTGPGPWVVQLTHPSVANWRNPDSDPTGLVVRALAHTGRDR